MRKNLRFPAGPSEFSTDLNKNHVIMNYYREEYMRRPLYLLTLLYFILHSIAAEATPIDPASLIKVTPNANPKCVDYYIYNNALYCSTTGHNPQPVDPQIKYLEKLNIEFDDRPWKLAWGKKEIKNNEVLATTIEYIPNGEDIENWNELITSQFFPGLQKKVTPKQFAEFYVQQLKDTGYKSIVTFHEDTPEQVIFEYRIEAPENQKQDEMQMITADDKGMYILHYVIKKADMGQKNRDKWIKNLKESTIKK